MIEAHGKKLVHKILTAKESEEILRNKKKYVTLLLNKEQSKDVRNIATGVYSPLSGFLKEADFKSVVASMRLTNGTLWPIPIVLDIDKKQYSEIRNRKEILLLDHEESPLALLKNIEIYSYDKDSFAQNVYGVSNKSHPGVEEICSMGDYLVGGEITMLNVKNDLFPQYNLMPSETRRMFQMRGWQKVVAFQTRNVPHIGHEFLQKKALEQADGLFIQPVIGKKKADDFRDEHIISSYEMIIDNYYPKNKTVLGILPLKMRYAGPREAIFHAIIRQNFGCTHFIVGRDHAGVKNFYAPFAAQEIFDTLKPDDLQIEILKFPEVVYDRIKQKHCFIHECEEGDQLFFSGSKLREHIRNKELPPSYIIRPEVFHLLAGSKNLFVESMEPKASKILQRGFVLWFTGLSQAGKSTIANRVYEILKEKGVKIESLDGDIVRETLTKDLGFSKEDRDTNIRRVGFVAKLLSRNDIGVTSAFITPYRKQREGLRLKIPNFIEVFVNTPIEVCEKRDKKGLYEKARKGEIKNFTGIDDPYEVPENPEIILDTVKNSIEKNAQKVIKYLYNSKFLIQNQIYPFKKQSKLKISSSKKFYSQKIHFKSNNFN